MGWTIDFAASDVADGRGMRALEMNIYDADNQPIEGMIVQGKAFRHADANRVVDVELKSVGDGRYLALVPVTQTGWWQLELTIDGADEPIAQSIEFEVLD